MTTTVSAVLETARNASRAARTLGRHGGASRRRRRILKTALYVSGAALVPSAVVTVLFRKDMADARDRLAAQPTEIFQSSRHGDIEYRVSGTGLPVLISHGVTGGVDQAEAIVSQWRNFQPDQYRFIYVSRFGYLGSDLPGEATARTQAAAYRDLLEHLGIERVFIAGNSAGGPSAMWFAIDYPHQTNGLILVSSAVPGPKPEYMPELVAKHDFIYWAAVKAAPGKFLSLLVPKSVIAQMSEAQKDFVVRNAFIAAMPISERTDGIIFDDTVSTPGINQLPFEQIKPPTLIFQSTDDSREDAGGREMARRIPNSTLVGLTGGHFLLGHETEVQHANAEFIARHMSR